MSAVLLAAAVLLIPPSDLSRIYAFIVITTSVLPGLILTGDVKMLNAGAGETVSYLRQKVIVSALFNLSVGGVSALLAEPQSSLELLAILTIVGAIGATAQAFSSVWYYTQQDKTQVLRSKAVSTVVKAVFAAIALTRLELTFALLGMTLGAIVEFSFNFRSLPWLTTAPISRWRDLISMLGVAYGVSRFVSASIRLGLVQLFGSLIASFLILEQLVGGVNSVFEKYFLNSPLIRHTSRIVKVVYLLVMVPVVPRLITHPLQADSRATLAWLMLVACAGLLPLAEMYSALQRHGQTFVALGSTTLSVLFGVGLGLAAWRGDIARAALIAYVALPGMTFLFYWISSIYVRNNLKY